MSPNNLNPADLEQIRKSKQVRMSIAEQSLAAFMHIYFPDYISRPTAPFQREIYSLLEDDDISHLVLMAFRGSGKSTIVTLGCPIWSALGKSQKKFLLIASQTQPQAQQHLRNIKREFEGNDILRKDYGPLNEIADEWGSTSLVLPKFDARISAISVEQSIRGARHGPHRPDLIIADDVEDSNSVRTREGRNKVFDWYTGEIIPAGDGENTKRIVVGNLLHEDSLLMRLKERFKDGSMDGTFRSYPVYKDNKPLWLGKYPNMKAVDKEKMRVGDRISWHREYLLEILPDDDQVIYREWLKFYDSLPDKSKEVENTERYYNTYLGIDLAISQRDTADYTAMVAVHVYGFQETLKIYVDPLITNKRITHLKTLEAVDEVVERIGDKYSVDIIVEDVGYQSSVIEQLDKKNFRVEGFKIHGVDKRARFMTVSHLFESGKVYFPRSTSKQLVNQLVGFGVEKHDDLVDALVMCLAKVVSEDHAIGSYGVRATVPKENRWEAAFREWDGRSPITRGLRDMRF